MKFKEKTKRRLRNVCFALLVICIVPLCERGRMISGARSSDVFAGKNIICAIDLGDDMYGAHGLETGLNYELINRFAADNRCKVTVLSKGKKACDWLDSLRQGKVDIVIMHHEDSASYEGVLMSRKLNSCSAWAVDSTDTDAVRQINRWISHITASEYFPELEDRFSCRYNPHKSAERGVVTGVISPYDSLLRKYASELGWDWRMLAAVVYQESKFSINSRSARGAQGLMQVMPQTAEYYDVDDLLDPEKNLIAGTSHLKRLQNMFRKYNLEQEELIKFTLAAYNAGEGRIADCRSFAASQQMDSTRWSEIVKVIPLMREDSILEEESVRLGKFQGHETIAYVDSVMSHYDAFCRICPSI